MGLLLQGNFIVLLIILCVHIIQLSNISVTKLLFASFDSYQVNPFTMAYRFKGDPNWDDLLTIYDSKEPIDHAMHHEVILLSSEDEIDVDHVREEEPAAVAVRQPNGRHPSSKSSKNIQRSLRDYVGYASDSDDSLTNNATTANAIRAHGSKLYLQVIGVNSKHSDVPAELHSGNSNSQASSDPFGKRTAP